MVISIALVALLLLLLQPATVLPVAGVLPDEQAFSGAAGSQLALMAARVRPRLTAAHASAPVVTTTEVFGVTGYWAFAGGSVNSDGGSPVTSRGLCWSAGTDPTIDDRKTDEGAGSGDFTGCMAGLQPGTAYSVRAYATNNAGTGYGAPVIFSTLGEDPLDYLGQPPPGETLVRFAPGIVPDWFHSEVTVSPDGREIYWTTSSAIFVVRRENGRWTTPQVASFCVQGPSHGMMPYDDGPVISPDNRRLFFMSLRPVAFASPNQEHIWYVDRTPTGWSEPRPLPPVVNTTPGIHWQISMTNSGTLYFGAQPGENPNIFLSRLARGEYSPPEPLAEINNLGFVACPFIAPDESYIIYRANVNGEAGLFVSFKTPGGSWLPPRELLDGMTSFVSRDGKYLFTNHHWISARFIEDLRPR